MSAGGGGTGGGGGPCLPGRLGGGGGRDRLESTKKSQKVTEERERLGQAREGSTGVEVAVG
jgi:hypothetical protein